MRIRPNRLLVLACAGALIASLATGCAGAPNEAAYTEIAAESYRTTLLVASEVFTTYERIEGESPLPPESMPLELFDGMDRRIGDWQRAIKQEERRLSVIKPPAGYSIVHEDLLAIDAAMLAALDRLADVESRRIDGYNLGDLRREVNEAFYDETDVASQLEDVLPRVGPTAVALDVFVEDGGEQMQEIIEYGEW